MNRPADSTYMANRGQLTPSETPTDPEVPIERKKAFKAVKTKRKTRAKKK